MFKSIGVVIAAFAVLELCSGYTVVHNGQSPQALQSRNDAIQEMSDEVAKLINTASAAFESDTKLLEDAQKVILNGIDEDTKQIKQDMRKLDDDVIKTRDEATKAGKDIDSCVNAERLAVMVKVLPEKLLLCSGTVTLAKGAVQSAKIKAVEKGANLFITYCNVRHPISDEAFKQCVLDKIDESEKIVENAEAAIDDVVDEAGESSKSCLNKTVADIEQTLNDIAETFSECVNKK